MHNLFFLEDFMTDFLIFFISYFMQSNLENILC